MCDVLGGHIFLCIFIKKNDKNTPKKPKNASRRGEVVSGVPSPQFLLNLDKS
jgi:hypothetical protein